MLFVLDVVEIIHRTSKRGEFFTVKWADNTSTTVKLMEGDTSDEYTAFMFAVGKKMFGDKGKGREFVHNKKEVFESRVAMESSKKEVLRRRAALEQSLATDTEFDDIPEAVYRMGFVPAAMFQFQTGTRRKFKK